jgi:hypothetical protein
VEYDCSRDVRISPSSLCLPGRPEFKLTIKNNSVSTLAAVLLDLHTYRKVTKRGTYIIPEDDQDAQHLTKLKSTGSRSEGYGAPADQSEATSSIFDSDIGYHSRYGEAEEEVQTIPFGPLGDHQGQKDMGYHNRFFRD